LLFDKESIYLGSLSVDRKTRWEECLLKPLLFCLTIFWAMTGLLAQPGDSLPSQPRADTLFVIPAGPVAGAITPSARVTVLDTIAGWARITVEGWIPVAAVADRLSAAAPGISSTVPGKTKAGARQCEAITKKGTRCKRNAEPNSRYCWQHRAH
jgi:hypothetical protein